MVLLDYNKAKRRFLDSLQTYYYSSIDLEIEKKDLNVKSKTKKGMLVLNLIAINIIRHNLMEAYSSPEEINKIFNINDSGYNDELYIEYCEAIEASPSRYDKVTKFLRSRLKSGLVKSTIKRITRKIHSSLSSKKRLHDYVSEISKEPYINFEELFDIFNYLSLNNSDQLGITLYIMILNIKNNILNTKLNNEIIEAHELIKRVSHDPTDDDVTIDIYRIVEALKLIKFPNIEIAEKILSKKTIEKKEKVKPTTPVVMFQKTINPDYAEGYKAIENYYSITNNTLKKILKMDEIIYVVNIMQSLNFSEDTINKFLKTAYKKHKELRCIDRYLDISNKIDYLKEIEDVSSLRASLKDLFREYLTAKTDEDKEFWFNAIDEELLKLEDITMDNYSYELSKNKSQE